MTTFRSRLAIARLEVDEWRYFNRMGYDLDFDAHCLACELEFERARGIRTIAPNERGLKLLAIWYEFISWFTLAAYLFVNAYAERFDR